MATDVSILTEALGFYIGNRRSKVERLLSGEDVDTPRYASFRNVEEKGQMIAAQLNDAKAEIDQALALQASLASGKHSISPGKLIRKDELNPVTEPAQ